MRLLFDTHAFLWWDSKPGKLPEQVLRACEDPRNELTLSVVSIWEIQIKRALGKLTISGDLPELLAGHVENGIAILPVHLAHVLCLERLPDHHKDPFDRLLIAQALEEGFVLMTADTAISKYSVPVLW
jgi:PIN domain nuclease of toxin-antitoxin system